MDGKTGEKMLRSRDIFVVIIFSLAFRAIIEILASNLLLVDAYYLGLLSDAAMYALMAGILWRLMRSSQLSIIKIIGAGDLSTSVQALGWAGLLLAFTLGENAIEVLIASHVDIKFAYSFWHFHASKSIPFPISSPKVILFLAVNVLMAPVLEELVFRDLLLRTLQTRIGLVGAMIVGSLFFTLLHFGSHYYLSTFVFSMVLYYIYASKGSLLTCIVIHAAFNLLAFLHQYYYDIQWTRSVSEISSLTDWLPQLGMFAVSSLILVYLVVRYRKSISPTRSQ